MQEKEQNTKSWARELAVVLIIGLGVLMYNDKTEMVSMAIWPVTTFAIGAFIPTKLQQLQSLGLGR